MHQLSSQYLKWFHTIEKNLWSFFALFGALCARCAERTRIAAASGRRKDWPSWCCCMIDNQVHDNWDSLNAVQVRYDPHWYEPMRRSKRARMPGNGPCPALGDHGCRIRKCRPITCTTQLCCKMLMVLNDLGIVKAPTHTVLQIEDLVPLPNILPSLYGTDKRHKVLASEVDSYIAAVRETRKRFSLVSPELRQKAIDNVLHP